MELVWRVFRLCAHPVGTLIDEQNDLNVALNAQLHMVGAFLPFSSSFFGSWTSFAEKINEIEMNKNVSWGFLIRFNVLQVAPLSDGHHNYFRS
jgi:hypothetical protein